MNNVAEFPVEPREIRPPRAASETRPFLWSVRRELWENRSLYLAPLMVAAVIVISSAFSMIGIAERRRAALLLDEAKRRQAIGMPYDVAATILIFTWFVVAVFYCLEALHGERRDRSILFWKSMPLSDRTTVLSKVTVPLAVLPGLVLAIALITQMAMLLISSVVLAVNGISPATTWANYNIFAESPILIYGLIVIALWHAPIYALLILLSAWSRRSAFLWAFLPPLLIALFEKLALGTTHFARFLRHRVVGAIPTAFDYSRGMTNSIDDLTPGRYLSTPALWIGLALAMAFLAVATRMRRVREPQGAF